ncbi:MAG TPA: hypothetical protein VHV30_16220 [Polyangiaceae bacterium]|jgi:hypothetical protein|nr:hypothetical protein [Polyangiaceae bacterium]
MPSFRRLLWAASLASGVASAVFVAPSARAADAVITEEARTHFAAGVALLQDPKAPRYEEAYREFRAAYAASPSWKILGNLGLCAMKIERDAEAIQAYETYLKEAGPEVTADQRAQAQRDLLTLKEGHLDVTVSSDPPGATIVDSRTPVEGPDVRNSYGAATVPLALGLRHGHHVITARLAGYLDQQWEFDATEKTAPPHVFVMVKPAVAERPTVHERPIPTAAYVSGGATIALAIGGAVVGALAIQKHSDYETANDGFHTSQASSDRSSGQTLNVVTDALFGAAIIGAGITTYFVLTRPSVDREVGFANHGARPKSGLLPPRVSPNLGPHGGGVDAIWSF